MFKKLIQIYYPTKEQLFKKYAAHIGAVEDHSKLYTLKGKLVDFKQSCLIGEDIIKDPFFGYTHECIWQTANGNYFKTWWDRKRSTIIFSMDVDECVAWFNKRKLPVPTMILLRLKIY